MPKEIYKNFCESLITRKTIPPAIKTIDNIVFDNYYAPYKDINDSSFPKELIHSTLKYYNMYAWYGR